MVDRVEHPISGALYVFISYASADREWVRPVAEALEGTDVPVWNLLRVRTGTGAF
ncbi:MAG: TIR domain-containing protein [Thermomicrobiales bacterium]